MTDLTINEKLLIELALDRFKEDVEKESDVQELLNQIDKLKQKMVIIEDDVEDENIKQTLFDVIVGLDVKFDLSPKEWRKLKEMFNQ